MDLSVFDAFLSDAFVVFFNSSVGEVECLLLFWSCDNNKHGPSKRRIGNAKLLFCNFFEIHADDNRRRSRAVGNNNYAQDYALSIDSQGFHFLNFEARFYSWVIFFIIHTRNTQHKYKNRGWRAGFSGVFSGRCLEGLLIPANSITPLLLHSHQ
jgi:hypothetical protein